MMTSGETASGGAEGAWQENSQAKVPMPDGTPKTKRAAPWRTEEATRAQPWGGESFR